VVAEIVAVPMGNGKSVLVEAATELGEGLEPIGRPGSIGRTVETFQESAERLSSLASEIADRLRGLANAPEEISVEFGIKVAADASVVVARTSGEANFKVTLQWQRQ
jgi:hypothetical protein